jgi:hypothetical protein
MMKKKVNVTLIVSLLCLVLLAFFAVKVLTGISKDVSVRELDLAENTVRRYAVQCYAMEGSYPKDLAYLVEHYGLYLNENKFNYHYRYNGANLLPSIMVFINAE